MIIMKENEKLKMALGIFPMLHHGVITKRKLSEKTNIKSDRAGDI